MSIMSTEPIQIRRYPNRRFYDRSRSCYITLGDLENLVLEGRTIVVQDSRTGEDITRQILTQILLERHPEKIALFPAPLLAGLLRANDLAMDFWGAYFRQALLVLEGLQRPLSPMNLATPWLSAMLPGWPNPLSTADASKELESRLAALEERIAQLETTAPPTSDPQPGGTGALDRLEQRLRDLEGRRSSGRGRPGRASGTGKPDPRAPRS
jgi:polyhydroxyalkanoate synthesis repressor PhaR